MSKSFRYVFELPGGHIDFGEDIIEGLKQEIFEEFEMRVRVGAPFAAFTYSNEVKGSHSVVVVYFAKFIDPIESIQLHSEDHSTSVWIAESEIDTITSADKPADDQESQLLRAAFALLSGDQPHFA